MTMIICFILCLGVISESWAACGTTANAIGTDDKGNYCGICNDSGTCKWSMDSSKKLNVYAADGATDVAVNNYSYNTYGNWNSYPMLYKSTAPWAGLGATSLNIGDNITSIGDCAFIGERKIADVSGMKDVKSIGDIAFHVAVGIKKFEIPEGLSHVGVSAFQTDRIKELVIPDNLNTNDWNESAFYWFGEGLTIKCKGDIDSCKTSFEKFMPEGCVDTDTTSCLDATFEPATKAQCTGSNYYWSGTSCNNKKNGVDCADNYLVKDEGCVSSSEGCGRYYYKKENSCVYFEEGCGSGWIEKNSVCIDSALGCGSSYKDMGGWCNRIRYTPAEAAAVANDDNTNVVTITFKK